MNSEGTSHRRWQQVKIVKCWHKVSRPLSPTEAAGKRNISTDMQFKEAGIRILTINQLSKKVLSELVYS